MSFKDTSMDGGATDLLPRLKAPNYRIYEFLVDPSYEVFRKLLP